MQRLLDGTNPQRPVVTNFKQLCIRCVYPVAYLSEHLSPLIDFLLNILQYWGLVKLLAEVILSRAQT